MYVAPILIVLVAAMVVGGYLATRHARPEQLALRVRDGEVSVERLTREAVDVLAGARAEQAERVAYGLPRYADCASLPVRVFDVGKVA